MRFRHIYIGLGSFLVILLSLLTDPDTGIIKELSFGAGTVATLIILVKAVLYVGLLHFSRKGLMDYLNLEKFFTKAALTPEGAGMALIAVGVYTLAIALVIFAGTH